MGNDADEGDFLACVHTDILRSSQVGFLRNMNKE
jgi:hypothetical protein